MAEIRGLTAAHRGTLAEFSCAGSARRSPWSIVIEDMVRNRLADELETGASRALGSWDEDRLCALIVWTPQSATTWRSSLLATAHGCYKRGHAERLKREVLALARACGVQRVISYVHGDNIPMQQLNEKLGGYGVLDPDDPFRETLLYVIDLT